ncbi:MAG TPA: phosphoglycolate phosphatase [Gammaproteobacteria bacterium]|nr:phosphoglycolate phosphatase [Gammaproteobacteria bacterium]|tara:strand:+ start:555 stop:1262 length:708 start_codon:yes stop_codon:yes gene_type:complete
MNVSPDGCAFIFDLDGTLVDSAPDIAVSVAYAVRLVGEQPPSLETIKGYIGNGADRLIHRSLTNDHNGVAEIDLFTRVRAYFLEHYGENFCRYSTPYIDVNQTLTELCNRDYKLACVTNKPSRFTDALLRHLGLDRFFPVVLSGDTLSEKKPAPNQLLYVAKRYGITPRHCVMVGDTGTDILAAKNANMPSIYVTYGYGAITEIELSAPLAIVDSLSEIVDLLPNVSLGTVGIRT